MQAIRITPRTAVPLLVSVLVAGCGISPTKDNGFIGAQQRLNAARADARVRELAAVPLEDAERTLRSAAETDDRSLLNHFVYLTEKKIDIARAIAERRTAEAKLNALQKRVEARTERSKLAQEVEQERLRTALQEARMAEQRTQALRTELSEFKARATARGTVLTLSDVLFDSSRAELNPGAKRSLESLVSFLRENPDRRIVVEGYTDNSGSPEGNLKLSLARANAVKSFLVEAGIAPDRISTVGHGQNYPIVSNDTMAGRQRNRRVEILIERSEIQPVPVRDADRQESPVAPPPAQPSGPAG